jgi:acetyl esterase/lipase
MILEHLVINLKKDPHKIILMGDSAGANLVLALLSHLNHPHPDQSIPRLNLSSPLQAAVLISAWISFKDDVPSMTDNKYNDIVTFTAATRWAEEYLNEKLPFPSSNEYTEPRDAAPEWWTGLPVRNVISMCSEDECLIDLIRNFLGKLRIGLGEDRVIEDTVKGECHDALYFLPVFTGKDSKMGQVLEQRMVTLF